MADVTTHVSKGECLYLLSEGSYSDYMVEGLYVGPPGVDLAKEVEEWLKLHPGQKASLDTSKFAAFVIERTGLRPIGYDELWLSWDSKQIEQTKYLASWPPPSDNHA